MKKFFATVATFFSRILTSVHNAWIKHSPAMFRQLKRFGKFLIFHALRFINWTWKYFMTRTIDVRIAIIVSIYTVTKLLFGTLNWLTFICCVIAWAVVWRKEITIPAIAWVWKISEPARNAFFSWLWKILSFGHGIPIAMIGWGVTGLVGYWISFHFSKELATFFGMIGLSGVMFGLFFYAIQIHNSSKTKPPTAP